MVFNFINNLVYPIGYNRIEDNEEEDRSTCHACNKPVDNNDRFLQGRYTCQMKCTDTLDYHQKCFDTIKTNYQYHGHPNKCLECNSPLKDRLKPLNDRIRFLKDEIKENFHQNSSKIFIARLICSVYVVAAYFFFIDDLLNIKKANILGTDLDPFIFNKIFNIEMSNSLEKTICVSALTVSLIPELIISLPKAIDTIKNIGKNSEELVIKSIELIRLRNSIKNS